MAKTPVKEAAQTHTSQAAEPSKAELATIRTVVPAVQMTEAQIAEARKQWSEYEEMLTLPFVPKTDCAIQQPTFTIVRLGEREAPSLNNPDEVEEQWVLLVMFEQDAKLSTRAGDVREFKRGDKALVSISKGSVQNRTAIVLSNTIANCGGVPGMTLRQLEPKQKGHNGAIVLTAA